MDQSRHPINAPYGNTYNPNWRNHPNLSWKSKPPANTPTGSQQQQPPPLSPVEQVIVNLSKVVGHFVEEQKTVNAQTTQKIETLEGTLNKKIDDLQYSVSRLTSQQQMQEKGKSPSQTQPNPRGQCEVSSSSDPNSKLNEVKAIITLRSGKELTKPSPKVIDPGQEAMETEPEEVVIKQTIEKNKPFPPFPQSLKTKKKAINQAEILEVLRQVKVNIPLLDMIKQVPTYAKFLKDLCIVKRGLNVDKKAFLTEQVSAIIQCKTLVKYKDPGYPTISVNIGGTCMEKALLDLGASVNLLPYSMYKQLGLGELKPTSITLSLADRSIKIPKGTVEDVLIQVDKFYYPVDFVVLDTKPAAAGANYVPIILGRPFLDTSNAIINCRNGVMQLTFGNMSLELNIFHLSKKHMQSVEDVPEEVCIIDAILEEQDDQQGMMDILNEELTQCAEEQQEVDMKSAQGHWRRKHEILPLVIREEVSEPQKIDLKPLPMELKYDYLEDREQFPVVISALLSTAQEGSLLQVLKQNKQALGWKIADLKGISPTVCTHHIYLEEEAKSVRQPQRRLNPHMQEVVRAEFLKLLQYGIIYPISYNTWVSPTHVVPKKLGVTMVHNEKEEEIPTRLTTGWRVCIDYRRINEVTRKDHFPLPLMVQLLERISGYPFYCFLDGYSGYFQIETAAEDQEKTTFTCLFGMYAYRRMPFGLCNAPATFQQCMLSIFSYLVERIMEVYMDDITVYGGSFEECLINLETILHRCIEKNLMLNWEQCHFIIS